MNFLRIILVVLLFLLGRRLYLMVKAGGTGSARGPERPASSQEKPAVTDLTDQDISDADFEEIP